ncbi:phosphoadenylyl-sulfate reductase [Polycladidibacter hongkongensis]|uniref:phosphoadenylyl-sulfate reductase n=1 Tax=Polycladidibacter hongkongensis TaxID=1647556 RepID=UPI000832A0A6|nr:phosphoadenylyl-sulfate reductase [Pseudovibrio hongkongensis]
MEPARYLGASFSPQPVQNLEARAQLLNERYGDRDAQTVLAAALAGEAGANTALVSSFGADSAVLLHMAAQIDRDVTVVFIDTGKLFGETKTYRDTLIERLGLTGVRSIKPEVSVLKQQDPMGALWIKDTDACCHIRKVVPLATALEGFDSWISGRKRHQASTRAQLQWFEAEEGRIKVNPLADWSAKQVLDYAKEHKLPPHPLVAQGYPSIGCMPCTDKVAEGEDPRSGRWRGKNKTECGIHFPTLGKQADGSGI